MTLGELRSWILRTVKRPELTHEALDAINYAIEYAAIDGDYAFDLVEGTLAIDPQAYAQSIVIADEFPLFRKVKYLRPSGYNKYLGWRDPARIFDKNGCEATNCYYMAGGNIVIKLQVLAASVLYGYYATHEIVTSQTDINTETSYMKTMPSAIHELSCAYLWDTIGNEAESQRAERRGIKLLMMHKTDKQDGVAHS